MEDRGIFNGRGFWALALLWLPAGVVARALVRFAPGLVEGLCCKPDVGVSQIRTTTVLSSCFCVGQTVL